MSRPRRRTVAAWTLLVVIAACAVNPATGRRELMLVSESQEVQLGRDADPSITASYGLVDRPELQEYVAGLGTALAVDSERPDLPWSFKVVDDPIVNAFALPGGFIYVTRGILAHFDSEAELAGVLGHEIGHVTARHSASQISRQQLQQIGLVAGMVVSERFRQYGGLAMQAVQLLNLSYSRGDESQADRLGLRYIAREGYDADAMIGVFEMLGAVSGGGGGRLPEWQMTHPLPENREAAIRQEIAATAVSREGKVNRDAYLDMIDGLVWGENPREGYFEGARFLHPELAFEVTFPEGWQTVNQRTLVAGIAPTEDAVLMLGAEPEGGDPSVALQAFLSAEGVSGGPASTVAVNGLPAARARFRLSTEEGTLAGEVMFLRYGDLTYRLLGYATPDRWATVAGVTDAMFRSFAEVTDPGVLGVQPLRLDIVTLRQATSLNSWVRANPQPVDVETLERLNRVSAGEVLGAGTRIKTVAGTPVG
jgi:predicted Zn-dependent protease